MCILGVLYKHTTTYVCQHINIKCVLGGNPCLLKLKSSSWECFYNWPRIVLPEQKADSFLCHHRDSQGTKGTQDWKEAKVKLLYPGGKWVTQVNLDSEACQGERASMEFLEVQEQRDRQDLEVNRFVFRILFFFFLHFPLCSKMLRIQEIMWSPKLRSSSL